MFKSFCKTGVARRRSPENCKGSVFRQRPGRTHTVRAIFSHPERLMCGGAYGRGAHHLRAPALLPPTLSVSVPVGRPHRQFPSPSAARIAGSSLRPRLRRLSSWPDRSYTSVANVIQNCFNGFLKKLQTQMKKLQPDWGYWLRRLPPWPGRAYTSVVNVTQNCFNGFLKKL